MDAEKKCLFKSVFQIRDPRNRPICISSVLSTAQYSNSQYYRARTIEPVRSPTILSHSLYLKQDIPQTSALRDLNKILLPNPAVVPQGFEYASSQANIHNKVSEAIRRPARENPPFNTEQCSYIRGLESFTVELSHRGISQETAKIITR